MLNVVSAIHTLTSSAKYPMGKCESLETNYMRTIAKKKKLRAMLHANGNWFVYPSESHMKVN